MKTVFCVLVGLALFSTGKCCEAGTYNFPAAVFTNSSPDGEYRAVTVGVFSDGMAGTVHVDLAPSTFPIAGPTSIYYGMYYQWNRAAQEVEQEWTLNGDPELDAYLRIEFKPLGGNWTFSSYLFHN